MSALTPATGSDNVRLAVAAILVSVFALSAGDAVIKLSSAHFPIWQIFVLRSLAIVPIICLLLRWRARSTSLVPKHARWVLLRSALLVVMWIAYYTALPEVDLALAAAAYYTAPLMITWLSARVAGERVGWVVRVAVALGFAGVLVMLRPDAVPLGGWVALPFIAALLYALAMVVTRARCGDESPLVLALALNLAFIVTGAAATVLTAVLTVPEGLPSANPFLFGAWTSLGPREWVAIAALALAMLVGSIGAAVAYQSGPAPVVATFDYTYLVFAGLWGVLLFAEVPDPLTLLGMLLIGVGGVLAVRAGGAANAEPVRATTSAAAIVRAATPDDVPALTHCARSAYARYVDRIGREPAPMTADFAAAIEDATVLVAEHDRRLAGYVVVREQGAVTLLENIAVRPEHSGRGVGRALIEFVEARARHRGQTAIELYTNAMMTENLAMYPRLGYTEIDRRREQGFDRVFFRKRL